MRLCRLTLAAVAAICVLLTLFALLSPVCAANRQMIVGEHRASKASPLGPPDGLPAASRCRAVKMNPALTVAGGIAEGDTLELDLFPDAVYTALVDRVNANVNGTVTVRARIPGSPLAYALITTTAERSLVDIEIPEHNRRFVIRSDSSGDHYLADVSDVAPDYIEGGPSPIPPDEPLGSGIVRESATANGPLDPATIDVMIVYTPAARTWADTYGGGIANVIAQAVAKGQLACDNSNTVITLRLVHSAETSYTESADANTDLNRLTNTSDGYMDEIHTLRNTYGADLVSLLERIDSTGGLGWLLSSTSGRPTYAFNLCRVQQSAGTYTVIHEQGHNMGCHHSKIQTTQPGPGLFSYSAGWRWIGTNQGKYCSVMTYASGSYFPDGQTHTQVGYFSNPSINYQGVPTGDAVDGDNARTLREIKHVIAGYRTAVCNVPSVTTHPASQTKCAGLSVTFTVAASGTPTLTYQWRKNGANVGTNSASYTIGSVQASDAGNYDCVVTNSCGTATSNAATLTVNTPPSITVQPGNETQCVGQSVTLTLAVSGTAPLTYQWRKSGVLVGTNSASYTISSVQTSDAGYYDCVVTNSCGTATSSAAALTVNTPPSITVQPVNKTVCKGGAVTLSLTTAGSSTFSYQWRKNGATVGTNSRTYSIFPVQLSHAGNYDCVVTNSCGSVTSDMVTLTVSTGPVITTQPANSTTWVGGPASLSVTAASASTIAYVWRKAGVPIEGADEASFTIPMASSADNGSYDCVLTNSCGSATSAAATLTVIAPAAAISNAKLIADGQPVALVDKPVTFASTDFFYVQETNQCAGIRVEKPNHGLIVGDCASLAGIMATNSVGERFISAASAASNGTSAAGPVAMAIAALCGSDWHYDAVAQTGQRGGTDLVGLNNIGLLVKTWGDYTRTSDTTFTLSDGCSYPVNCVVEPGVTLSTQWQRASIIGISSIFKINDTTWWPRILVRSISAY